MCSIITNFRIGDLHLIDLLISWVKSPMGKIIYGYWYLSRMSYACKYHEIMKSFGC